MNKLINASINRKRIDMAQEQSNGQISTVTNTQIYLAFQNIQNMSNFSIRKYMYILDHWLGRKRVKSEHHLSK